MLEQISGALLLFIICITIFVVTLLLIALIGWIEHWLQERHLRDLKRVEAEANKLRKFKI